MGGDDFVEVQLTELGKSLAGDAAFRVHEGKYEFAFMASESKRVTKAFDWERVLKNITVGGTALFEIVPAAQQAEQDTVKSESSMEHIARDIREGRFPEKSPEQRTAAKGD